MPAPRRTAGATAPQTRPKMPARPEHVEQAEFIAWANAMAGRVPELGRFVAVPNFSGRLGKVPPIAAIRQAQRLNAEGRRKGYPDLILDVKRGGYAGLRLETKRTDATPSDVSAEQRDWHRWLRSQGYHVVVCKGFPELQAAALAYLALPPE